MPGILPRGARPWYERTTVTRTIHDWVAHATAATDPAEVERLLVCATAVATSFHDWRALLEGIAAQPLASRERLVDVADRTLALAITDREVWGFRVVAKIRAAQLGDAAGARAALEAGVRIFREPDTGILGKAAAVFGKTAHTPGYVWVLLSAGFVEALDDREGQRLCLETGRDSARASNNADDLCAIASAWVDAVDRDAGIALLVEAEAMARNGSADPWTLSNAWSAAGDAEGVRRVLSGALREARTCGAALHVVKAWGCHGHLDEARTALERAGGLATTTAEWLELAEVALDAGLERDLVRAAIAHAETLATDDDARGRVSRAYQLWMGDEAAAARVGPRGVQPEALRSRARNLPGWNASASGLFDWLRARVTPEELTHIAAADYGADLPKHLAALRDLCDTGVVPRSLPWEPHEVLALSRWSSGEKVNHRERALCCTLLTLAGGDLEELVTNGPILVESCLALGREACALAESFLAWKYETVAPGVDGDDDLAIATLLLVLLRTASDASDPRLVPLVAHLVESETGGLSRALADGMSADLWREIVTRILVPLAASRPDVADLLIVLDHPT
jgi:hypothetical protein